MDDVTPTPEAPPPEEAGVTPPIPEDLKGRLGRTDKEVVAAPAVPPQVLPGSTPPAPRAESGPALENAPAVGEVPEPVAEPKRVRPLPNPAWDSELERSAASAGVNPDVLRKFVIHESGGDPTARAKVGTAGGLFQFIDSTWAGVATRYPQLNLTNKFDPIQQARAAPYYLKEIEDHLKARLGRDPNDAERRLGWFLGAAGAASVAGASGDTPISSVVEPRAIAANPGVFRNVSTVADLYAWASKQMNVTAGPTGLDAGRPSRFQEIRPTLNPMDPSVRQPYTGEDEAAARVHKEQQQFSLVQAAGAVVQEEWKLKWLFQQEGKSLPDPSFVVSKDLLGRDDVKALPPNYLRYLGSATSQDDFDFRVRQSHQDHELEQRLAATPFSTPMRLAAAMTDPMGLLLSAVTPFGWAAEGAKVGRLARAAAVAADGAVGNVLADLPMAANKPSYDMQDLLWGAAVGAGGYVALNRSWMRDAPHIADEAERFVQKSQDLRQSIEQGTFGGGSAGAASTFNREAVRGDIEDFLALKTPETAFAPLRFDFAKLKNSQNPGVAALADRMGLDAVGNKDKNVAVRRPIEADRRFYEERANILWSQVYDVQAEKYRERTGQSWIAWKNGGEDAYQREITGAVRNSDPMVKFDPEVQNMATVWQELAASWREHARNPGKLTGETMRPTPGAEMWSDDKTYVPRFINWDRWRDVTMNFGDQQVKKLLSEAIAHKNPDLDRDLAYKLGDWYYSRIRSVEAGQELTGSRKFSGLDVEMMRKSLTEELGLSQDEVGRVLYQATARDESKGMSARQKARQHMDENFSLRLSGRDGTSRDVFVHEIWEDNMRSIVHSYNHQMAGVIALARLRIENPRWKPGMPDEGRFLVDGIHKDADWEKLLAQVRAVDDQVRPEDRGQTLTREIKNLQWMYDTIRGKPQDFDRTQLGQYLRVIRNVNFMRLMPQAGFASVAEFGMVAGATGWKHMLQSLPGLRDFKRNAIDGKLLRDELEDLEYIFMAGTDHIRGTGMTFRSPDVASASLEPQLSTRLEKVERATNLGTRATSALSLAPLTTYQERLALQAALSKFRDAAENGSPLRAQRMRLLGLDEDMQKRVLEQIKANGSTVTSPETGRPVKTLGLDKWDEQVRSSFEFAINTWVRRMIQQNDLGQMNAMLGHPLAKVLFQFRNFSLGAWSKNTLSNLHMRDFESLHSAFASMAFGGLAYMTQTALNGLGLSGKDQQKYVEDRLSNKKIAAAAFQRAGWTSLMPGGIDFGAGLMGLDPLFDTRSTGSPTQGWGSNPTTGLIDSLYRSTRSLTQAAQGGGYTSDDFRNLSRAVNVFHNYPLMLQTINATSGAFPSK